MKPTVFLIPGMYPKAAKAVFDEIAVNLRKAGCEVVILEKASDEELFKKTGEVKPLVLVGKSLGGKIAIDYQLAHENAAGLVLLAPATRAKEKYEKIGIPILLIHGTKDEVVTIENSRTLKQYFKNCELIEVQDADHAFKGKESQVAKTIEKWISSLQI